MSQVPTVKYRDRIAEISKQLNVPDIEIFASFLYLQNGEMLSLTNCPPAAQEYAESGLIRADVLHLDEFRKGNRVIFSDEYTQYDETQKRITDLMTRNDFYRVYCLSRFSTDCSLLFAANSNGYQVKDPQAVYKKTVGAVEDFWAYFIDETIDIYCEYLPLLAKTRFATDPEYRRMVIKNRDDQSIEKLSKGEADVLYWASQGKTSEETAMLLDLSKQTVDTYRKRTIAKLNASNIAHAVYLAQYHKLIA